MAGQLLKQAHVVLFMLEPASIGNRMLLPLLVRALDACGATMRGWRT